MNNSITIGEADQAIYGVKTSVCIDCTTRDAAEWAYVILAELRQQADLGNGATMEQLYKATVNLRKTSTGEAA